ncbi:MAG: TetR/AcrR family transcriptional regulator [Pseudonocardia sp.]|nr:TetR/AcrR family transcriptional regulator [Pseudonocardia sp.]
MQSLSRFRNPRPRILRAATELLTRRSAAMVSISEVAHAARVSKASVYQQFPSKDQLVETVVAQRSDEVHRRIAEAIEGRRPGRERILWLCADLTQWYERPDFAGCLVINTAVSQRPAQGTKDLARAHVQRYYDFILTELAAAGVTDGAPVARIIVTLIEGATLLHAVGSHAAPDLVTVVSDLLDAASQPAVSGGGGDQPVA